jgi:hypothetical protein
MAEERLQDARDAGADEDEIDNLQEIVDILLPHAPPIYPVWPAADPETIALNPPGENDPKNDDMPGRPVTVVGLSGIAPGTRMVDFHGERDLGRYYTLAEFEALPFADRRKKNPSTRQVIEPANVSYYIAEGGKRRKASKRRATRKSKKSRKATRRRARR